MPSPGEQALAFLRKYRPAPWFLSFGKTPSTHKEYNDSQALDMVADIDRAQSSEQNCWFRLGYADSCTGAAGSMSDGDVQSFILIPIDIDIPKSIVNSGDRLQWKASTVNTLSSGTIVPIPSVINSSGNGVQAFYLLESPHEVCEEYEGIVFGLAARLLAAGLPADPKIRNFSRLMRLPCGRNYKAAVENIFPEASVLVDSERRFKLEQFFGIIDYSFKTLKRLKSTQAAAVFDDLWKLYPGLHASADALLRMQRGPQPNDPEKWSDESRCMFSIVQHLVNRGNSDAYITQALMLPGSWTEANLSNKDNPQREIDRKLETCHGRETCIAKYNREFCMIQNYGGKARMVYLKNMSFQDPKQWQLGRLNEMEFVQTGTGQKLERCTELWLKDQEANRYDEVVFSPGVPAHPDYFNTWTGWKVKPAKGDWSLFRQHLLDNVCAGSDLNFQWLQKWMAFAIQYPSILPGSAIVITGGEGTGKGTFTEEFSRLFGCHSKIIQNARHLTSDFNAMLQDTILLTLNESVYSGSKHEAALLKGYITDEFLTINPKGVNSFQSKNALHIIITTNEEHAVLAGMDARRFFCLRMSEKNKQDWEYFAALRKQMDNGGREAMLHDLMAIDLTGFKPGTVPQTGMLRDQKALSLDGPYAVLMDILYDGIMPGSIRTTHRGSSSLTHVKIPCKVFRDFINSNIRAKGKSIGSKILGGLLKRIWGIESQSSNGERVYIFPSLSECRKRFAEETGIGDSWPNSVPAENMLNGHMDDTGWNVADMRYGDSQVL